MYTPYEILKFWLPIVSAFGLVIKAYTGGKKSVSEFCDKLLTNHLSHIEKATTSNAVEAKETNVLLRDHSGKLELVQNTLNEQYTKQVQVWDSVVKTLVVLEYRKRRTTTPKKKR
jgi:hypothetical protein